MLPQHLRPREKAGKTYSGIDMTSRFRYTKNSSFFRRQQEQPGTPMLPSRAWSRISTAGALADQVGLAQVTSW
jgi:hypothetical protein